MLHLAYLSHGCILEKEDLEGSEISVTQIQVNYQTKKSI